MAIPLTWNNIFVLVGLIVVVLTAFSGATSAIMEWQLGGVDKRLNDRMSVYQRDQDTIQRELDRIEHRLEILGEETIT